MQLTLVRNANLILNYAGKRLLVDPFWGAKHAYPSFTGLSKNPMVDLPLSIEEITDGVNAVLITHIHNDHFDGVAQAHLEKSLPLYCQPGNEDKIEEAGFTNVTPITDTATWESIRITRTGGYHGRGGVINIMGTVSGFVLKAQDEPTVYIVGDSVLVDEVREAIAIHKPDIIITNSGGAMWDDPDNEGERVYILMETSETVEVAKLAPDAQVVTVHLEALDHCTVSRQALRAAANVAGIAAERFIIPNDGETLDF